MNFWIRNGIFAVLLSGLAYYLLANHELIASLVEKGNETDTEQEAPAEQTATEPAAAEPQITEPPQQSKKPLTSSKNKAAEGLSNFYASIQGPDEKGDGPKIRNNVVYLPEPRGDLEKILEAKTVITRPLRKDWQGSTESRPFRTGSTLFQKLVEYAEQDGLEVMWRLNRDLVIKDPFRINKEILATAYQVGNAISGHFPEGVDVYFCYQQRTIVFQTGPQPYLAKKCRLLTSQNQFSNNRSYY